MMAAMNFTAEIPVRVVPGSIQGKFVVMAENVLLDQIETIQDRLNDWARGTDAFCVLPIKDGQALYFDKIIDYEKTAEPNSLHLGNASGSYHILNEAEYGRLKWLEEVYSQAVDICARDGMLTAWFTGVAQADINSRKHALGIWGLNNGG
jgi:hypothetical protein